MARKKREKKKKAKLSISGILIILVGVFFVGTGIAFHNKAYGLLTPTLPQIFVYVMMVFGSLMLGSVIILVGLDTMGLLKSPIIIRRRR